jgi:ATPase family associated with various cellular activities (AAA)
VNELASPYSTGGGGEDFEARVLAYYLGCVLTRSIPRGLPDAVATSVSSQALYQCEPLDDILVRAERSDGEAKLALQVKRDIAFGEKDEKFEDVMRRAWETFTAEAFREGVDRFGIVLGLYGKTVDEHYTTVLTWARHAATAADFFQRVRTERLSSKKQRFFLALLRKLLNRVAGQAVTDEQLWRFCRSFVLLHFDLQAEGSRDAAQLRLMLQLALNIEDATKAQDLETRLFELASAMKPAAGTHSTETLRAELAPKFTLRAPQQVLADVERLRENAQFILRDIETTAGGVSLARTEVVEQATAALGKARLISLAGEPGTGKSGVLRFLIERAMAESSVLLLSGDRLTGTGWPSFAHDLGLTSPLRDLLRAIATGAQPTLFIDGLDRVSAPDGQRVINDLLRAIAEAGADDARPWTIVFTARTQNLPGVLTWLATARADAMQSIEVTQVTDREFAVIAEEHPTLALLDADERFHPITRNLFMIGRLTDPRIADQLPTKVIATELDVATTWWTYVVGAGGAAGVARQALLIALADDLLRATRTNGPFDPGALHSLEADRIVSRDNFGVVRFTHDIFEDWSFARLLGQKRDQLVVFLSSVPTPFRLQRAVRLFAAMLLESGDTPTWGQLLAAIEADAALKERWHQTFVSSPLLSARGADLLQAVQPLLLEGAAERLRALLTAAATLDVGPNAFWGPMLRSLPGRPDLAALFMDDPTPRWPRWIPLVWWLTAAESAVPGSARVDAVRVLELWQVHAPEGSILRAEVADVALKWLTDRMPIGKVAGQVEQRYYTALRRIVFLSGDVRPDAVTDIVQKVAENRHDRSQRQLVEAGSGLSKTIPAAYVDALLKMVIRERRPRWHHLIDDFDFDDRPFYPASPMQGPFLFLLQNAEAEGLRLIHTLANTATDRWRERESPTPAAIVLNLRTGPQEFFGAAEQYLWFRPDGSAPPSVVSGLMALEFWMERQIESGRDPVELFDTVLAGSRAIAVPGLCLGMALAYPDRCLRAALPIVSKSHFWLLDVTRFTHDMGPSISSVMSGMLMGDATAQRINADRDERPQRKTDIRYLAPLYLFGAEDDLREAFTVAIGAFGDDLPIFYEEQRAEPAHLDELHADIQREMAYGDAANYVEDEYQGQRVLRFEKPQFLVERDAPDEARSARTNLRASLQVWADKTIEVCGLDPAWTPADAANAAAELGGAAALNVAMNEEDDPLDLHHGKVVAATAAALAVAAPVWLREQGQTDWCIEVLDAASRAYGTALDGYGARALIPNDPRIYAVQGAVALLAAGVQDDRVRHILLRLSIDRRVRVVTAVGAGMQTIWQQDRALGWELLALGVRSNLSKPYVSYSEERDPAKDEALVAEYVEALRDGTRTALPRVAADDEDFFAFGFLHLAHALPIDLMWSDDTERDAFATLAEDLIAWTIALERAEAAREHQYGTHVPDEWNDVLGRWLAQIAGVADDPTYERLVLLPLTDAMREPLPLVAEYLKGYMWRHFDRSDAIPSMLLGRWTTFVRDLLASNHIGTYRDADYGSHEVEDLVSLMIFMRSGLPMFKQAWTHVADFAPVIGEWCAAIAPSPRGFSKLLLLLEKFVSQFTPADVLAWLVRFASTEAGVDPAQLTADYGDRTAQTLNSLWGAHAATIASTPELRARFGALVDALMKNGIALAGVLTERLRNA